MVQPLQSSTQAKTVTYTTRDRRPAACRIRVSSETAQEIATLEKALKRAGVVESSFNIYNFGWSNKDRNSAPEAGPDRFDNQIRTADGLMVNWFLENPDTIAEQQAGKPAEFDRMVVTVRNPRTGQQVQVDTRADNEFDPAKRAFVQDGNKFKMNNQDVSGGQIDFSPVTNADE